MTELVKRAQRGDPEAFEQLMERSKQSMYKVARAYFSEPMDVDDAIAETVMTCWQGVGRLRQPEYFRTWLIRVLINKCNDLRANNSRVVSLDALTEAEQTAADSQSSDFESLVAMLDERYRPAMVLYYGEGFRIREISEMTGAPEGTVASHLKRGREQLADRLRKEGAL